MTPLACPVCGSKEIRTTQKTTSFGTPYGPSFDVPLDVHCCNACGEEGDFDGSNDPIIEGALRQSERDGVKSMLKNLAAAGISEAYMKRVLRLRRAVGTPSVVHTSEETAALLRIITTYPWILRVADERYSPDAAFKHLVIAAGKAFWQRICRSRKS